ncbi:hypothetical protein D3C86_2027530 [compost metagenome]
MSPRVGVKAMVVPAVGVDRYFVEYFATKELIDRQIGCFALDVPESRFNRTNASEYNGTTTLRPKGVVVHLGVQGFDSERVCTND